MILLLGPSASGKTEVAKCLRSLFGIQKAVTHTTRAMRVGEKQDIDYHFVSEEEFLALKEKDAFVETACYNGNHYGCSKAECGEEKCIVLDPQGVFSFLALQNPTIVVFYLDVPEDVRKARMEGRLDKPEDIASRLENDKKAFDPKKLPPIDFTLTDYQKSPEEIASRVYKLYKERIG